MQGLSLRETLQAQQRIYLIPKPGVPHAEENKYTVHALCVATTVNTPVTRAPRYFNDV